MEKLNCEQAKRLDLVEYLAFLGHQAQKISNGDYCICRRYGTKRRHHLRQIGTAGKSFFGCIGYCLQDKINLSEARKNEAVN